MALFAGVFATKETLSLRFGQLAELRNAIRHSREVTAIVRNDGEAAIRWLTQAIPAAHGIAGRDAGQ